MPNRYLNFKNTAQNITMIDKNIKALFLTRYSQTGASSRYRFIQYFPYFEEVGINCIHKPLFDDSYLEKLYESNRKPPISVIRQYLSRVRTIFNSDEYDVILLEKELFPYLPATFERILDWRETPYIVDYDDAVFHNYDQSENILVRSILGDKIDVVMRSSDAVVAGNEYLADRARAAGASRVEVIPTVIDIDRYRRSLPDHVDPFVIGWIGSPSTFHYVEGISEALETVCEERDAELAFVGSGREEFKVEPNQMIEWSEETEVDSICEFDVGIMPLQDGPWERGKCGLKLIQYMGCGKPVVASPVGMNESIVSEGKTGYFASNHHEWVDRLTYLADNTDLARQLGENGFNRVQQKYCMSVTAPKLVELIRGVTS